MTNRTMIPSNRFLPLANIAAFVVTTLRVVPLAYATSPSYPPDPFAAEYRIPDEREVGTAAGQLHFVFGSALGVSRNGTSFGGKGTIELMTNAYLGLRSSLYPFTGYAARRAGADIVTT